MAQTLEERRAYNREYKRKNRVRIRAQAREWARAHPEANRRWKRENPERAREIVSECRARNPERARQLSREKEARRRARKREQSILDPQMSSAYGAVLGHDPCVYCGREGEVIDHIVPLAKGGDNEWSNLTAACGDCNRRKSDRSLLTFMRYQVGEYDK